MSKRTAVSLLIIGIAALTFLLVWVIMGGVPDHRSAAGWGPGNTEILREEIPVSEIDRLETDLRSEDVEIKAGSGSSIVVVQYGPSDSREKGYVVRADQQGKTLRISAPEARRRFMLWGVIPQVRVEISVPEAFTGSISARASSGEVDITGVAADEIRAETSSGDVTLWKISAKTVSSDSTSGNVDIENVEADDLSIAATSGDVWVDGMHTGKFTSSTTSGSISVKGGASAGTVYISTSSGDSDCRFDSVDEYSRTSTSGSTDIVIENARNLRSVFAEATSGDVRIMLPAGTEVNTSFSTTSGDANTIGGSDKGLIVSGAGIPVTASTTSGDITLEAA